MNIKLSTSVFLILVAVLLNSSCSKKRKNINDVEISYWYNGEYIHYSNLADIPYNFRESVTYHLDTAHYHYLATFPFSSDKTKSDINFYLYNDTLYAGQQFRLGNWTGLYEEYWQTFFTSNDLTTMIVRSGGNSQYKQYFYANRAFVLNIDTVSNGKASGRFEGKLFFYTDGVKTDSIELKQGVFRNVPIVRLKNR